MHMADALLSPAVGGTMWVAAAGAIAWSSRAMKRQQDEAVAPLMGVLGAFIFAAQMINFTIPATGSSGHIGGGLLLAVLLGPAAAFLTLASVLVVQALFFADGGLLALGCNILNLGLFPCFIAYPLLYRPIAGDALSPGRLVAGSLLAAVFGLQLGALGVVLQTTLSGISELPFGAFSSLMLPIHLAIGIVEGLVTAAVLLSVRRVRPELLRAPVAALRSSLRPVLLGLGGAALLTGGVLAWFASSHPDGLEWAILHTAGHEELEAPGGGLHALLSGMQEMTAILPDYDLPSRSEGRFGEESATTLSGIVGGVLTIFLAGLTGWCVRLFRTAAG